MRAPSFDSDEYLKDAKDAAATLITVDREKLARHIAKINAKAPGLSAEVRQFFDKIAARHGREAASRLFKWVLQLNPVTESGPPKKQKGAHNPARDNRLLAELAMSKCSARKYAERLHPDKLREWGFASPEQVCRRIKALKAQRRTK